MSTCEPLGNGEAASKNFGSQWKQDYKPRDDQDNAKEPNTLSFDPGPELTHRASLQFRFIIPGSVHAFFGRYGLQAGDGLPGVSRAVAEAAIVSDIQAFLASLR